MNITLNAEHRTLNLKSSAFQTVHCSQFTDKTLGEGESRVGKPIDHQKFTNPRMGVKVFTITLHGSVSLYKIIGLKNKYKINGLLSIKFWKFGGLMREKKVGGMKKIIHILAVLLLTSCQTKNTWECEGDCNNGWGIKTYRDGGIERGTWKNGELIGHGYQIFGETSDFAGDSYQGEFLQGYNGFGKYNDVSEDATYIGYFKNGKFEGKGKLTFGQNSAHPNRYYDGDWKNGMRNGYGVNFWGVAGKQTNNLYQGEWKNDDMDGFGRYDWPDKGIYIGKWKNGEQNGEGIFIFPDGDTLKGLWFGGYCKDMAVMETGKDASYFKTLFDEITYKSNKSNQRFIDELSRELINSNNHSNYRINFPMLRNLLDTALKDKREVLSKLAEINEYDKGIPFKQDYVNIQYAGMDVLNESEKWISLNLESGDKALIQRAYNTIIENVRIMKQKQEKFEITRKRFSNKYLKKS